MKLTRKEVLELGNGISMLLRADDNKYEFNYALIRNQSKLKGIMEEIGSVLETGRKERGRLQREHCAKNADDEPIMKNDNFTGLVGNTEYEAAMEAVNEKEKEYFKEEVEIESYTIKAKHLPKKINGLAQLAIQGLIEGEDE